MIVFPRKRFILFTVLVLTLFIGTFHVSAPPWVITYRYAVKFQCLPSPMTNTVINIHNPYTKIVEIRKKFVGELLNQTPGNVTEFEVVRIPPNKAVAVDCNEIIEKLSKLGPVPSEGYVVLESPVRIDVTAIYLRSATLERREAEKLIVNKIMFEILPPKYPVGELTIPVGLKLEIIIPTPPQETPVMLEEYLREFLELPEEIKVEVLDVKPYFDASENRSKEEVLFIVKPKEYEWAEFIGEYFTEDIPPPNWLQPNKPLILVTLKQFEKGKEPAWYLEDPVKTVKESLKKELQQHLKKLGVPEERAKKWAEDLVENLAIKILDVDVGAGIGIGRGVGGGITLDVEYIQPQAVFTTKKRGS